MHSMNLIHVDYQGSLYFWLYTSCLSYPYIWYLSLYVYWQVLQQKFEDFLHDLNSSEDRVTSVTAMATEMIEAKHFETEAIKKRSEEVVHQWNELKEVAKARQEVSLQNSLCYKTFKFCENCLRNFLTLHTFYGARLLELILRFMKCVHWQIYRLFLYVIVYSVGLDSC